MMRVLLTLFLAALLSPSAPAPVAPPGHDQPPLISVQQPTPPPEGEGARPRVSLSVLLALVCVFNLSVVALLGSIALRRRLDSINPDK